MLRGDPIRGPADSPVILSVVTRVRTVTPLVELGQGPGQLAVDLSTLHVSRAGRGLTVLEAVQELRVADEFEVPKGMEMLYPELRTTGLPLVEGGSIEPGEPTGLTLVDVRLSCRFCFHRDHLAPPCRVCGCPHRTARR